MKNSITTGTICLLLTVTLFFAFFNSCKTIQKTVDSKDLSYLYNPTRNPINPRYNVINQSDESSVLSVKFFANDLFFSEANAQGVPTAQILLTVKLFNISQGKLLADTVVYNLSIVKETGRPEYIYDVSLKVEMGIEYMAEIKILDRLRLKVVQAFVPFNTLSYNNKYNFKAQGHFEKNELFNPVVRVNEYVNLVYTRTPPDSLFISFYKPFREVPDAPSMILPEKTLDYQPEIVVAIPYSDTIPMMFPREGIYLCSVARDIGEGFTFLNLGASYPSMTAPEVMIDPLAYLASGDEVTDLKSAIKPKMSLDQFWIKCGGNVEKARELIRIYYTRVLYSNYYFTSYKEGWRSERGMIYIIYGPPDKVYKTSEGESWGYRKPVIKSSWAGRFKVSDDYLFFNFKKKENLFSDNDYYLSRGETLVTYWDKAVLSWRKGIVFRLDNPEGI
ncbi:MAG: GWxTD domain-containing protein [Bacteroidota bacterium]